MLSVHYLKSLVVRFLAEEYQCQSERLVIYAMLRKEHIAVGIIYQREPPKCQKLMIPEKYYSFTISRCSEVHVMHSSCAWS